MVLVTERLERGPVSVGVGGFPEVFDDVGADLYQLANLGEAQTSHSAG